MVASTSCQGTANQKRLKSMEVDRKATDHKSKASAVGIQGNETGSSLAPALLNSSDKHSMLMAALKTRSNSASTTGNTIRSRRYAAKREAPSEDVLTIETVTSDAVARDLFIDTGVGSLGLSTSTLGSFNSHHSYGRDSSSSSDSDNASVHMVTNVHEILLDQTNETPAACQMDNEYESAGVGIASIDNSTTHFQTPPLNRQKLKLEHAETLELPLSDGREPQELIISSCDFPIAQQLEVALKRNKMLCAKLVAAEEKCRKLKADNIDRDGMILKLQNEHQRKLTHVAQAAGAVQRELKSKIAALEEEKEFSFADLTGASTGSTVEKTKLQLEQEVRMLRAQMDAMHALHKQDATERFHTWEDHQRNMEQQILDLKMQLMSTEYQSFSSDLLPIETSFDSKCNDTGSVQVTGLYDALSPDAEASAFGVTYGEDKDAQIASLSLQVAILTQQLHESKSQSVDAVRFPSDGKPVPSPHIKISPSKNINGALLKDESLSYSYSPSFRRKSSNTVSRSENIFDNISVTAVSVSDDDNFSTDNEHSNAGKHQETRGTDILQPATEDLDTHRLSGTIEVGDESQLGSPFDKDSPLQHVNEKKSQRRHGVQAATGETSKAAARATAAAIAEDVLTRHQSTLLRLPSFALQDATELNADKVVGHLSPDKHSLNKRLSSSRNVLLLSPKLHRASSLRRMSFRNIDVRKRSVDLDQSPIFGSNDTGAEDDALVGCSTAGSAENLSKPTSIDGEEIADKIALLMASLKEDVPATINSGVELGTPEEGGGMSVAWHRTSQRFQERRRQSFALNSRSAASITFSEVESFSADYSDTAQTTSSGDEESKLKRRLLRSRSPARSKRSRKNNSALPDLLDPRNLKVTDWYTDEEVSDRNEVNQGPSKAKDEGANGNQKDTNNSNMINSSTNMTRYVNPKFTHSDSTASKVEDVVEQGSEEAKSSFTHSVTEKLYDETQPNGSFSRVSNDAADECTDMQKYWRRPFKTYSCIQDGIEAEDKVDYCFFLLELNHRDYVQRIFDIVGHGLRQRVRQIYLSLINHQNIRQPLVRKDSDYASTDSLAQIKPLATHGRAISLDSIHLRDDAGEVHHGGVTSKLFGSVDGIEEQPIHQPLHMLHRPQFSSSIDDQVSVGSSHVTSNTLAYSVSTTGATADRTCQGSGVSDHIHCTTLLSMIAGEGIAEGVPRRETQQAVANMLRCDVGEVFTAAVAAQSLLVNYDNQITFSSSMGRVRESGRIGDFTAILSNARLLIKLYGRDVDSDFESKDHLMADAVLAMDDLSTLEAQILFHSASKEKRMSLLGWVWDGSSPVQQRHGTHSAEVRFSRYLDEIKTSTAVIPEDNSNRGSGKENPESSLKSFDVVGELGRNGNTSFDPYTRPLPDVPVSAALSSTGNVTIATSPPAPVSVARPSSLSSYEDGRLSSRPNSQRSSGRSSVGFAVDRNDPATTCSQAREGVRHRIQHLLDLSEGIRAHLLVSLVPSNAAVIELMNCFKCLEELLIGYCDHHKKMGHRLETQYMRKLLIAIEEQLSMNLSSTGSYQESGQQKHQQQIWSNYQNQSTNHSAVTTTVGDTVIEETITGTVAVVPKVGPSFGTPKRTAASSGASGKGQHQRIFERSATVGCETSISLSCILEELDLLASSPAEEVTEEQVSLKRGIDANKCSGSSRRNKHAGLSRTLSPKAMRRKSWSSKTAPIDESTDERAVIIKNSVKNGYYLLDRSRELVKQSEDLILQLDDALMTLAQLREKEYDDDIEMVLDDWYEQELLDEEERVARVIKELDELMLQMQSKVLPLRLSQHEELNQLFASCELVEEISNHLFSIILNTSNDLKPANGSPPHKRRQYYTAALETNSNAAHGVAALGDEGFYANSAAATGTAVGKESRRVVSIATLLIRSRSDALIRSVYNTWPHLTVSIAIVSDEHLLQNMVTSAPNSDKGKESSLGASNLLNPGQRRGSQPQQRLSVIDLSAASYGSDFAQSGESGSDSVPDAQRVALRRRGVLTSASMTSVGNDENLDNMVTSEMKQDPVQEKNIGGIEYQVIPSKELDLENIDFDSTKSLRLIGFTLPHLRDSMCYDLKALLAANFPLQEVKHLKGSITGSITVKDLRLAGYSVHQCLNVGFDLVSLRAGGFNDYELVKSGLFSSTQLHQVGCDIQRFALLSLFECTAGYQWHRRDNWGSVKPLSHWHGVHLDGRGQVVKLDLRSNCLKGSLPKALSLLTSLHAIDLYNNPQLVGEIPHEYCQLHSLRNLWIDKTGIVLDSAVIRSMLPSKCTVRK